MRSSGDHGPRAICRSTTDMSVFATTGDHGAATRRPSTVSSIRLIGRTASAAAATVDC